MNTPINKTASVSAKNTFVKDTNQDAPKEMADNEKIDTIAARILKEYRAAFEELAK